MIEQPLFDSEPIGNISFLHAAIIETPMQRLIIKLLLTEAQMIRQRSISCYSCLAFYLHASLFLSMSIYLSNTCPLSQGKYLCK